MIKIVDVHNFPFKITEHDRGIVFDKPFAFYAYYKTTYEILPIDKPFKLMFSYREEVWLPDRLQVYIYDLTDHHNFAYLCLDNT